MALDTYEECWRNLGTDKNASDIFPGNTVIDGSKLMPRCGQFYPQPLTAEEDLGNEEVRVRIHPIEIDEE